MQRTICASALLFAMAYLSPASAQLQSCADVGCAAPSDYCPVGNDGLVSIGVSKFSSILLNESLSWTAGFSAKASTEQNTSPTETRTFYLGQPPTVNLRNNQSLSACALFFYGITPQLRFDYSNSESVKTSSNGTCDDALTAQCVSDWTQQAKEIADGRQASFDCEAMAKELEGKPPASCKVAGGSWGKVEAKAISGSSMPEPITLTSCNPTINKTYSATNMFSYNSTRDEDVWTGITPVITILDSGSASEVHLSCLKPVDNNDDSSTSGFRGGSSKARIPGVLYVLSMLSMVFWVLS